MRIRYRKAAMLGIVGLVAIGCRAETDAGNGSLNAIVVHAPRQAGDSVSATLYPTTLFDLPLAATVADAQAFAERLPRDIADLADYASGISRRSNYWGVNTPTFQLRGFNGGDATAYYKDGFRYQGRGPMSMANVEAVEILRGPVSALYGWADPGGAVQVRVKQPTAEFIRTTSVRSDTWGRNAADLDLGGSLAGGRYRMSAAHEEGGSFRDRQAVRQTLLAPSFEWDIAGGRELRLSLEWLDDRRTTDYGIPAVGGAPADVPVSRVYTEEWGRQHSHSSRLALRWLQPAWGGTMTAAWSWYGFRYLEYRDVEPYSVSGTTVKRWYESYPEQYRWITGYLDWSRELEIMAAVHRVATRLELASERRALAHGELDDYVAVDAYNPVYGQAWSPTAGFSVYDQAWANRSIGWVVQDEIRQGAWTWLLGVRFGYLRQVFDYADILPTASERHTTQTDHATTPRLGVSWRVAPALSLYANHSSGKMPTLPQSRAFDGSSFAPVSGSQSELGAKMQPESGDWLAAVGAFDIERSNVLTRDPSHPAYSVQTGMQRSRGVEAEWQGRIAPGWRLAAQATWLDAFIAQDNRYAIGNMLPYAPKFNASAWLTHTVAAPSRGRWQVSGGIVRQGERFADFANGTRIPAYTRLDGGVSYAEKTWAATLAVENLADRRYFSSGVENRPAVIYPGQPRTVVCVKLCKFVIG